MIEAGRRAGIDKQVLLGRCDPTCNPITRKLIEMYPDELIGFVWGTAVDPRSPAVLETYVKKYGFKGAKLLGEKDWPLNGVLGCYPLFLKAAELGVPVMMHATHEEEGLTHKIHKELSSVHFHARLMSELGKSYPDTTFIFAHCGHMWDKSFQAAKPYPNLYFDVSGFDPERGVVEKAVEYLGAERILWGSDAPGRNYAAQLAKVQYADISERDKELVLSGNAIRLLRL